MKSAKRFASPEGHRATGNLKIRCLLAIRLDYLDRHVMILQKGILMCSPAICACLLANCGRNQNEVSDKTTLPAPTAPTLSAEDRFKRLGELDRVTAQWYLVQSFAADFVEEALGYKYGPCEVRKSEAIILAEQESAIARLETDASQEAYRAAKGWRVLQFEAANILRSCLGKEPLSPDDIMSNSRLLEIQRTDLSEMESQRRLLLCKAAL